MDESTLNHLQSLYAGRHKNFMAIQHPKTFAKMVADRTLNSYLMTIGEQAANHYRTVQQQILEQAGAIQDLTERQVRIDQAPFMADEIVMNEIVHVKL